MRALINAAIKGLAIARDLKRRGIKQRQVMFDLTEEGKAEFRRKFFESGRRVDIVEPGQARGAWSSPYWGEPAAGTAAGVEELYATPIGAEPGDYVAGGPTLDKSRSG